MHTSMSVYLATKGEKLDPSAQVVLPNSDLSVKPFLSINIHYPSGWMTLSPVTLDDGLAFVDQLRDAVYKAIDEHRAKTNGSATLPQRQPEQVSSC